MQPSSQPQWVTKTNIQTRAFLLFFNGLVILASLCMFLKAHPARFDVLIDAICFVNFCLFCFLLWIQYRSAYQLLPAQSSETPPLAEQHLPGALSLLAVFGSSCTMMGLILGFFLGKSFTH